MKKKTSKLSDRRFAIIVIGGAITLGLVIETLI